MMMIIIIITIYDCLRALACSAETTLAKPHLTSNIQQTKNEMTNVVINNIVVSS